MSAHVDVAVLGAGPAGATAAFCLACDGVRVLVLDRQTLRRDAPGETLAPSATPLLDRLGLLESFLATHPLPCFANRSSWGGDGRLVDYDFIRDRHGNGWHIDRPRFEQMLIDAAVSAGASLRTGTTLLDVTQSATAGWRLASRDCNGVDSVEADLVIDASGRTAAFARRLGVPRWHWDKMIAATASLASYSDPVDDSTTLVEAVPDGWWYSAALPGGRLAVAFMTDPDLLELTGAGSAGGWSDQLAASFHTRQRVAAGGYRLAGRPTVAAAGTSRLDRISGERWLAAGDAAAAYDPLSSHGIGTAMATGAQAARAAVGCLGGDATALNAYADRACFGFERCLEMRQAYYADESRWPEAPFWSRRRSLRAVAAPLPAAV